jgi:hypothetical protein
MRCTYVLSIEEISTYPIVSILPKYKGLINLAAVEQGGNLVVLMTCMQGSLRCRNS